MNDRLLQALRRKNSGRAPVWFMRQAGRYLPSYQQLRKNHSLYELFFTPQLAAEVTLLPIEEIGVDAAILFSDITVVAKTLGLGLDFKEGPVIAPLIETPGQIDALVQLPVREVLQPIGETVRLCRERLEVPLIGFCGGPFTVAGYLIEKGSHDLLLTKRLLYREPAAFHCLLELLTQQTMDYLDLQIEQGVQALQIFESSGQVLCHSSLMTFCLPYHERLIRHAQSRGIPAISFMRGSSLHMREMAAMKPDAISADWQRPLASLRAIVGDGIALQGNLDPDLLFAPLETVENKTRELLASMEGDPAFILNLGHGIKPHTPVEAVQKVVAIATETLGSVP